MYLLVLGVSGSVQKTWISKVTYLRSLKLAYIDWNMQIAFFTIAVNELTFRIMKQVRVFFHSETKMFLWANKMILY